ncbi:2-oxo-4-hydroxy-4-carboxy-5-ureidoimidazoline decarboxylase [Micrococcales bacterium 31B]|nr:2-oxo-4-hydroxy-4-carboxy-5-ureidoimidazoline decarboxylase [Micrococcales bacterium 31B]
MRLRDFNALPATEALAVLAPCVNVPRWAAEVARARPFADRAHLLDFAESAAPHWTQAELDAALSRHPRIGEQPRDTSDEARHSRREQAAVDAADAALADALRAGNEAYESKFGHVFLIRAAGRSGSEILDLLRERLQHDPATEAVIVAQQLREIALLRLAGIIVEDPS